MSIRSAIRWTVIVGFAALAIYGSVELVRVMLRSGETDWWFHALMMAFMATLVVVLPALIAVSVYRRRYDTLISILIGLAAVCSWAETSRLMRALGVDRWLVHHEDRGPLLEFLTLPLSLLTLVLPFYVAGQVVRLGHWLRKRFGWA